LFSSAVAQNTWQVTVGNATGGTIFTPNNITAATGDTVVFTFNPKNHSVTQSTFANPCTRNPDGFDSLFNPVALGTTSGFPTFSITVNNTNPIWVYCRQSEFTAASHCGKGMVFAVNPGAEGTANSFSNFLAAAKAIGASLSSSAVSSSVPPTGAPTLAGGS
ncbi:Cupredoxin, partial [Lactifluus subvellereus]